MILHLSAGGTPVTWHVTALYRSSYGIAQTAARAWQEQSVRTSDDGRASDEPQYVVEMTGDDEKGWNVEREDLFMGAHHLSRQRHDEPAWLIQGHTAPMPLSDALVDAVRGALRAKLIHVGYLIPRDEWRRRYPAQALISDNFRAFREAADAARAAGRELEWEPRWAMWMESPVDDALPFSVENGRLVSAGPETDLSAVAHLDPTGAMRLLNSGWTPDQTRAMLRPEPVEADGHEVGYADITGKWVLVSPEGKTLGSFDEEPCAWGAIPVRDAA